MDMITEANPMPPRRMRMAMTVRPNKVNVAATSTVTNPVTQTALTAVNSAST